MCWQNRDGWSLGPAARLVVQGMSTRMDTVRDNAFPSIQLQGAIL